MQYQKHVFKISYWAKTEKIELAYLRIFNAFGLGNMKNLWPSLYKASKNGKDFEMTEGNQIRDFIHVELVAKLFIFVASLPSIKFTNPFIKNIATGRPNYIRIL